MSRARTRLMVILTGLVVAIAVVLGLMLVGGPDTGRRDRRDAGRLTDLRLISQALVCHASGRAQPPAPMSLAEISPACLSADRAADLRDPSGADYVILRPAPDLVRVCAEFEATSGRRPEFYSGWPPFDPATGCVGAALTRS